MQSLIQEALGQQKKTNRQSLGHEYEATDDLKTLSDTDYTQNKAEFKDDGGYFWLKKIAEKTRERATKEVPLKDTSKPERQRILGRYAKESAKVVLKDFLIYNNIEGKEIASALFSNVFNKYTEKLIQNILLDDVEDIENIRIRAEPLLDLNDYDAVIKLTRDAYKKALIEKAGEARGVEPDEGRNPAISVEDGRIIVRGAGEVGRPEEVRGAGPVEEPNSNIQAAANVGGKTNGREETTPAPKLEQKNGTEEQEKVLSYRQEKRKITKSINKYIKDKDETLDKKINYLSDIEKGKYKFGYSADGQKYIHAYVKKKLEKLQKKKRNSDLKEKGADSYKKINGLGGDIKSYLKDKDMDLDGKAEKITEIIEKTQGKDEYRDIVNYAENKLAKLSKKILKGCLKDKESTLDEKIDGIKSFIPLLNEEIERGNLQYGNVLKYAETMLKKFEKKNSKKGGAKTVNPPLQDSGLPVALDRYEKLHQILTTESKVQGDGTSRVLPKIVTSGDGSEIEVSKDTKEKFEKIVQEVDDIEKQLDILSKQDEETEELKRQELIREQDDLLKNREILEGQYKEKTLSQPLYEVLKGKNEERLGEIERMLSSFS